MMLAGRRNRGARRLTLGGQRTVPMSFEDDAILVHPKRIAAPHERYGFKVVCGWWRGNCPFQRSGIPRVGVGLLSAEQAPDEVVAEYDEGDEQQVGGDGLKGVPEIPAHPGCVGVDAPRHSP